MSILDHGPEFVEDEFTPVETATGLAVDGRSGGVEADQQDDQ